MGAEPDRRTIRFVRALLAGGEATRDGNLFRVLSDEGARTLPEEDVASLVSAGVLSRTGEGITARPEARAYVRRALAVGESFAAQHGAVASGAGRPAINLDESPLVRLATGNGGEPAWLMAHQVEAGERFRVLAERARLSARLTMSYSAAHTARQGASGAPSDLSDMALDARQRLNGIARSLPSDCFGVLVDVLGFGKGLTLIESERQWPRRSAKLVLRIALEALAGEFGIGAVARGRERGATRGWQDEGARPELWG